jgi:hypothetical protein
VTIDEARRITIEKSQDGLLHLRQRIEDDRRVAEAAHAFVAHVRAGATDLPCALVNAVEANHRLVVAWALRV